MRISIVFMLGYLLLLSLAFNACASHTESNIESKQDSISQSIKPYMQSTAKKIKQKLADKPKDTRIRLLNDKGEMVCYVPITPETGGAYLAISTCNTSGAKPARYDVFSRIAYDIDGVSFCITAPEEVAVYHRARAYVNLKPCVINDTKQQWKVKNGIIMSADEEYSLKDDGNYVYVAHRLEKDLHIHTLHPSMKAWLDTVATPYNLSISTSLAWDKASPYGSERFFIDDGSSSKNTTELFYNVETGHIGMYDGKWGLKCLYSDLKDKDWDWAWWDSCTDSKSPDDKAFWQLIPYAQNQILLVNRDKKVLRVATQGDTWGTPYVVQPEFVSQDINALSNFIIDNSTADWLRFIDANIGDNLAFCPAPDFVGLNVKSPLPRDFELTPAWVRRLLDIVNTNNHSTTTQGICGVCFLQSFQIIAELLENPAHPRASGGYFFDTQDGADPFISFGIRNSLLYETLNNIAEWFPTFVPAGTQATTQMIFEHSNNLALMSAISMLPQYEWTLSANSSNPREVPNIVDRLFSLARGSAVILLLRLVNESGQGGNHAMVALRTRGGVVLVPTNVQMELNEFRDYTRARTNRYEFFNAFEEFGFSISNIAILEADFLHPNLYANTVSFSDCSGAGNNRRGNGDLPRASQVNQCASGRCLE